MFDPQNVIITGFRLIEEVDFVKQSILATSKLVVIEANQALREDRKLERNRDMNSSESVKERDYREMVMGTKT